jgi:hypothetical protein
MDGDGDSWRIEVLGDIHGIVQQTTQVIAAREARFSNSRGLPFCLHYWTL